MNPSILAEIADLTNRNQHTQARLVLAEHIGATGSVAMLRLIQSYQDKLGYLDRHANDMRGNVTANLLNMVENSYGYDALAAVYAAL